MATKAIRDPMNDDDYDGNDDQIEDLKELVGDLQDVIETLNELHDKRVTDLINANSDNVIRRRKLAAWILSIRPGFGDEGKVNIDKLLEECRGR